MSLGSTSGVGEHTENHVIRVESVLIRQLMIWSAGVAVVVCRHPSSLRSAKLEEHRMLVEWPCHRPLLTYISLLDMVS